MFYSLPPITRGLIIVNVLMFAGELLLGDGMTMQLALWPVQSAAFAGGYPSFQPWQLLTYGFVHAGVWHLFVTLYGTLELYLGVTGTEAGVAHFAHLGGMAGAWLLIQYWRGRPPFRAR